VNLKIAVYTIALNEEKFIDRWYESAKNADYLLIADTGSTDNTINKAKSLGINVFSISVNPWRFDTARNASLFLIPPDIDYCIQLDMDEILVGNWREELEQAYKDNVTHPKYDYYFSKDIKFDGFKIHPRHNTIWRYPIHEAPYSYGGIQETHKKYNFSIEHYPDPNKSRGKYLDMLKEAILEYPGDARMEYYLGREYYYYKDWKNAYIHLGNAIGLDWWQKLESYDMIAICAYNLGNKEKALEFGEKAYNLNPSDPRLKRNIDWYLAL
jgi:glycosyltransferase involved in cell wall biosynthesis